MEEHLRWGDKSGNHSLLQQVSIELLTGGDRTGIIVETEYSRVGATSPNTLLLGPAGSLPPCLHPSHSSSLSPLARKAARQAGSFVAMLAFLPGAFPPRHQWGAANQHWRVYNCTHNTTHTQQPKFTKRRGGGEGRKEGGGKKSSSSQQRS